MTKLFSTLICIFLLFSCGQQADEADSETVKEGNKAITISTDTAKLSKLISLTVYKPTSAKFKYVLMENSKGNERLSVPGPSDSHLEAVLYYDSIPFEQLKRKYFDVNYPSQNFDPQQFNFEWLDTKIRDELLATDTSYHGHPDIFFNLGAEGKLWFLNNKIFLTKSTM